MSNGTWDGGLGDTLKVSVAVLVPLCVLYTLLFVLGAAGNVFTLWKVCCCCGGQRHSRRAMDACICSLAAVDMIIVLLVLPTRLQVIVVNYWHLGGALCTLSNVAYVLGTTMAWVSIGIAAILVCATARNRPRGTKAHFILAIVLLALSWLVYIALSARWGCTAAVEYITVAEDTVAPYCTLRMDTYCIGYFDQLLTVYYALLAVAVCTMLVVAACCCAKHVSVETDGAASSARRTACMLLTVAVVRAACWLPQHLLQFAGDLAPGAVWGNEHIGAVWAVLATWAMLPPVVGVFVYAAFGYFRAELSA